MAAGGIIIAAAAGAAHKKAIEDANAAWGAYAKTKGLNLRAGRMDNDVVEETRVDGKFDNVSVAFQLAPVAQSWGITAVAVPLAPIALNLEITREGLFDKIAKVFGAKDLVLGDAAFDKAYMVSTTNESARDLLTKETRAEMLALDIATLAYDDGTTGENKPKLVVGVPRLITAEAELDRMLALLARLAKVRPEPEPFR
jgi:hypothetical protein